MSDTKTAKYVDARAVELVAGREAALVQEARGTVPGRRYRLSFSVGDAGNG